MPTVRKLRVGVIYGGRSGEHEISLLSARSVLAALDPQKYTVTEIAITHEGSWLAGDNLLQKMSDGRTMDLQPVALFPDPTRSGIYRLQNSQQGVIVELLAQLDVRVKGNEQLVRKLIQLLADELAAINQYIVHSEMCANWGYDRLHESVEKRAIQEMKHAEKLIARILFLEGTPTVSQLGAIHVGEDVPNRIAGREELRPALPPGYDFDGCDTRTLMEARVMDGRIDLPSRTEYRVLLLPN